MEPNIAFVIPTMDKLEYLRQSLPSIAKLGVDEIVVIDSSKREREAVEALCKQTGAIYVFAEVDRQVARNMGAEKAKSDWVCICDDDIVFKRFDRALFKQLSEGIDFMFGGWGAKPTQHYAWMFRRRFFLDILKGYDRLITGGDDLDITLRAQKLGKGVQAFEKGLYDCEAVGLKLATENPERWIKNKVLYSLTYFPLMLHHPFLVKSFLMSDGWRLKRVMKGEPLGRVIFESFMDRSGLIYGPAYYLVLRRRLASSTRKDR
jgi:glycosyltransferase involved in cell wall biosynthesis